MAVVFFDLGDTLASPKLSPDHRLVDLDVFPYVQDLLDTLQQRGIPLGIISNTGSETAADMQSVLEHAGIYRFFRPDLLLYSSEVGLKKDSQAIFRYAANQAGLSGTPQECMFVGEDSRERNYALQAGFCVVPHPCLVFAALAGLPIRYVRIQAPGEQADRPWRSVLKELSVVPLHIAGENGTTIYALATTTACAVLDDHGFAVDRFRGDPLRSDLYLLRDDLQTRSGFLNPEGQSKEIFTSAEEADFKLTSSAEGLFVALPADRPIEHYHFQQASHGHTLKLIPDLSLLQPFGEGSNARFGRWLAPVVVEPLLTDEERAAFAEITADEIRRHLDPYTGKAAAHGDPAVTICSRHILHPDNARATDMLLRAFQEIGEDGFTVRTHRFTHQGMPLDNVEAELAGSELPEIILVAAHLDSTGQSTPGYVAETDPAPGADDDGSGVAAVLTIARVIKKLSAIKPPKRTIRFVLFNAEEHGLVGSRAYARTQAALEAPIVAVYQMDMIGYNRQPPRTFEVHAGYLPSPDVQARSLVLAERLGRLAQQVSPTLPPPQVYLSKGPRPEDRDPAEGRSDHASFHLVGYAAYVASEDFFAGPLAGSPEAEPNPNYHQITDELVDAEYAADIARAIAAAAWTSANL